MNYINCRHAQPTPGQAIFHDQTVEFWLRHFHNSMYVLSSWKIRIKLTFHWSIGVLLYLYCLIERTLSMWPSFGSGSSCFGVCIVYLRFPDMELEPWDELPNPPTWSRFPATNFCISTLFSCQPSVNTWEFQWRLRCSAGKLGWNTEGTACTSFNGI